MRSRPGDRGVRWRARLLLAACVVLAGAACRGGSSSPGGAVAMNADDAARIAEQGAFGPTPGLTAQIAQQGAAWIDGQLRAPATGYPTLPAVSNSTAVGCPSTLPAGNTCFRDNYTAFPIQRVFFQNAMGGADQLRQRVALAWSEIFVVSSVQIQPAYALREYQQMLLEDAFANFRQILQDVTLSPVMGAYLNMANNNKGNAAKGISPIAGSAEASSTNRYLPGGTPGASRCWRRPPSLHGPSSYPW